ncbi:lamina-associated polypeptide 2, isoforms alpha/zeta-like isoform X2 [Eublepharis macularius]|nr:lamina-associated polypeptide 2, isoforms alpha/zeta-like isoform X2 [Eublepharis macularius]
MARMAKALEIDVSSAVPKTKDKLLCRIYGDKPATVGFPMLEGLEEIVEKVWKVPSDLPATSKHIEQMYKIKQGTWQSLIKHPPPSSLIAEEVQHRRSGSSSVPPDKEGKKMDALGRRQYSTSALALRIANYQTIMARYQLSLWEKLASYVTDLPADKKAVVSLLQTEAVQLSKQQMNAGNHAADTAARGMASAVLLRRHSWLRSTALSQEVKAKIEHLPFEGDSLFSSTTDEALKKKKARQTARSLGVTSADRSVFKPRYSTRYNPYQYHGRYRPRPYFHQYPPSRRRYTPTRQQSKRRRPFKSRPSQPPAQQKDPQGTGRQF